MTDSTVLSQRLARRGAWRLRTKKSNTRQAPSTLKAQVSQATRDRLIQEALASPAYEGLSLEEVSAFVSAKLDAFIAPYPWWYGHLAKDKATKPRTEAQRLALAKANERKREIQREVDTPYANQRPAETESHSGEVQRHGQAQATTPSLA